MAAVMAAERALGNNPRDVSAEKKGWDIESRDPRAGRLRFIEVKGRQADGREVILTKNEILASLNAPEAFILAIVQVEAGFARPAGLCAAVLHPRAGLRGDGGGVRCCRPAIARGHGGVKLPACRIPVRAMAPDPMVMMPSAPRTRRP